jgi:hypothetical protein
VSTPIFVGSGFVAKYPEGGGSFWVPLQYVLGLSQERIETYWLELLPGTDDPIQDRNRIARFFARTERLGIGGRALVLYLPDGRDSERQELHCPPSISAGEISARMRDGVLLNLSNSIPIQCRGTFALNILYDIDPGMLQLWSTQWEMGVGQHDLHFTIGQSIGEPECPVPTLGVKWHRVWPIVHLPAWPRQLAGGERYTTITQWWNGNTGYDLIGGELYEHNKRTAFLEFIDVPRLTGLELELAANITPGEIEDRALLAESGWKLVQPHEVAGTPWSYRQYIQGSRGEFSCAKPSVVKATPGWISDRTVCYLASGRPCIVQAAGAERHLRQSLGLQFFTNKSEAIEALHAVERNYQRACDEARDLAEEFFATSVVLPEVMNIIGISGWPKLGQRQAGKRRHQSAGSPLGAKTSSAIPERAISSGEPDD